METACYDPASGKQAVDNALKKLRNARDEYKRYDVNLWALDGDQEEIVKTLAAAERALSAGDLASFVDIASGVVRSVLQRLAESDVRLLRSVESNDTAGVSYEIFHDVLGSPILDWRERWLAGYRFGRRFTIVGWLLLLIFLIIGGILWYFGTLSYGSDDFTIFLLCVGAVLIPGLIFGAIGFLTGINWARTKGNIVSPRILSR